MTADADEPAPVRDHGTLRRRWQRLAGAHLTCTEVAQIDGYGIDRLDLRGPRPASKRLLLTAGTHGDEPAGPEAIADILADGLDDLVGHVDVVVLPCINPWGYVHDRRENRQGIDINRDFEEDATAQTRTLKALLAADRFDLFLEFHEDWEFPGYYLFECRHETMPAIGPQVIRRVRPLGPIYDRPEIDDVPISDGVATATPAVIEGHEIGTKPLPIWLFRSGRADRVITSETPSSHWDLTTRVAAHRAAYAACLAALTG